MICNCFKYYLFIGILFQIYWEILYTLDKREYIDMTKEPLAHKAFTFNGKDYTWWPISHFLLFVIVGFICRKHWFLVLLISVIWECFEFSWSYLFDEKVDSFGEVKEDWMMGNWSDLIFNTSGFLIGAGLWAVWNSNSQICTPIINNDNALTTLKKSVSSGIDSIKSIYTC
jgi:hypothetical protein